jgi:MFS family permease
MLQTDEQSLGGSTMALFERRDASAVTPGVRRPHYAWIIAAITFLVLLAAAGVRTAPAVLITPLGKEFGWSRASISFAVAVSLIWFGLGGPLAGTLIDRFGPRRVILQGRLC